MGCVADHVLSFREFGARLRAPQHHPAPGRQVALSGLWEGAPGVPPQTLLELLTASPPSPLDDAISRVLHTGRVPVDGGGQLARLCYPLPGVRAADLGRLQICPWGGEGVREPTGSWAGLGELGTSPGAQPSQGCCAQPTHAGASRTCCKAGAECLNPGPTCLAPAHGTLGSSKGSGPRAGGTWGDTSRHPGHGGWPALLWPSTVGLRGQEGENLPTQTGSLPLQRPSSMQMRLRSPSSW